MCHILNSEFINLLNMYPHGMKEHSLDSSLYQSLLEYLLSYSVFFLPSFILSNLENKQIHPSKKPYQILDWLSIERWINKPLKGIRN